MEHGIACTLMYVRHLSHGFLHHQMWKCCASISKACAKLLQNHSALWVQYLEQRVSALLRLSIADMLALSPDSAADPQVALQSRMDCASAAAEAWARLQALQIGTDGPSAEATGVHLCIPS